MERIKQALQRAREERVHSSGDRPESSSTAIAWPIRYTQTRIVEVSNEWLREQRIVSAFVSGPYTDAYKILRTHVFQRLRDHDWNTLAVTSPRDGEGKTLTAINLAISLSQEIGRTVLLVDADPSRSRVHEYFGFKPERGLSEYLLGEAELPELLVSFAGIDNLSFLPGGRVLANSAEMLGSPRMAGLVAELKHRYASRVIVFDLPPLLASANALAFAPHVEAALLVVEEGATSAEDVVRATELLQKTRLIGTVLNKSRSVPMESTVPTKARQRFAVVSDAIRRVGTRIARLRRRRG